MKIHTDVEKLVKDAGKDTVLFVKSNPTSGRIHLVKALDSSVTLCGHQTTDRWLEITDDEIVPTQVCEKCRSENLSPVDEAIGETAIEDGNLELAPLDEVESIEPESEISISFVPETVAELREKIAAFKVLFGRDPSVTVEGDWFVYYDPKSRRFEETARDVTIGTLVKVGNAYLTIDSPDDGDAVQVAFDEAELTQDIDLLESGRRGGVTLINFA